MPLKMTLVYNERVKTFHQLTGESKDEFRGRAVHAMQIPEAGEYYQFEQEGHRCAGPVGEHCLGMLRVHHLYAQDERKPGLFVLRGRKVFPRG